MKINPTSEQALKYRALDEGIPHVQSKNGEDSYIERI
jgi:hypothetical protein